ncbi:hypothetical protein ATANTOWER_005548 [Ataeniobius toweri]|uniref:Uncharacterized protein n=1 Tax=Ataeniobius toweri TaxID=208326 RepID=A0ABU7AF90_9TELE|nr:hypothetical protein [Ataeniobius toweri]
MLHTCINPGWRRCGMSILRLMVPHKRFRKADCFPDFSFQYSDDRDYIGRTIPSRPSQHLAAPTCLPALQRTCIPIESDIPDQTPPLRLTTHIAASPQICFPRSCTSTRFSLPVFPNDVQNKSFANFEWSPSVVLHVGQKNSTQYVKYVVKIFYRADSALCKDLKPD